MPSQLNSGASLTAGQSLTAGVSNRYVLTMQTNCVLVLLDTSTNPNKILFTSPNAPSQAPQSGVVCTMQPNGILQIILHGGILCSSTGHANGACLFLQDTGTTGVASVRKTCSATGGVVWDTTQTMTLPPGAAAEKLIGLQTDLGA
jgi:hypothetical protein